MFEIIFLLFFIVLGLPAGLIYYFYNENRKNKEREERISAKAREEKERRYKLEQEARARKRQIELQKASNIRYFHQRVFPMTSDDVRIQSRWSRWPAAIHDMEQKVEKQKRALYNTTPLLIDSIAMTALFYPSEPEDSFLIYKTGLTLCTCPDFEKRGGPCKHIYRLFYELTHTPFGNPAIVDVDPLIRSGLSSLSDSELFVFFFQLFDSKYSSLHNKNDKFIRKLVSIGFLVEEPLSQEQCAELLNSMTKDQIILALAKKSISGFYPSWSKYKLVAWVLDNHPRFLRQQFRSYSNISLNPQITPWIDGVMLSKRCFHIYVSDESLDSSFKLYE